MTTRDEAAAVLAAEIDERVRRMVEAAPPWTDVKRERILALFAADRSRKVVDSDEVAA